VQRFVDRADEQIPQRKMILSVSHSSRPFDRNRCSLDSLTTRYGSPDRLHNLPSFEQLCAPKSSNYIGNITLWEGDDITRQPPDLRLCIAGDYKTQHAIVLDDQLVVCGYTFLKVIDLKTNHARHISDPWFQDGHTVFPGGDGEVVVACASSDAVLVFDLPSGNLKSRRRVPEERFGHNYILTPATDVRTHHIPNDLQLAHLNCAWSTREGILVSGLIHGTIGLFEPDGSYLELTRGFVGCHGVRTREGLDGVYFADSCTGSLIEMSWEGRIMRRFAVDSRWLHDVQWIGDDLYLFALSDCNCLELWDIAAGCRVWWLDMQDYGASVQFISVSES
jgi:WD40 repeat protein